MFKKKLLEILNSNDNFFKNFLKLYPILLSLHLKPEAETLKFISYIELYLAIKIPNKCLLHVDYAPDSSFLSLMILHYDVYIRKVIRFIKSILIPPNFNFIPFHYHQVAQKTSVMYLYNVFWKVIFASLNS